jgi:hypothetical protein
MSRKRKARKRLEQSRKREALVERVRLNEKRLSLAEARLALASQRYEDSMVALYRDADAGQRAALEAAYQNVAGASLKAVHEARIIMALSSKGNRAAAVI